MMPAEAHLVAETLVANVTGLPAPKADLGAVVVVDVLGDLVDGCGDVNFSPASLGGQGRMRIGHGGLLSGWFFGANLAK